jgi:hypothetical protein
MPYGRFEHGSDDKSPKGLGDDRFWLEQVELNRGRISSDSVRFQQGKYQSCERCDRHVGDDYLAWTQACPWWHRAKWRFQSTEDERLPLLQIADMYQPHAKVRWQVLSWRWYALHERGIGRPVWDRDPGIPRLVTLLCKLCQTLSDHHCQHTRRLGTAGVWQILNIARREKDTKRVLAEKEQKVRFQRSIPFYLIPLSSKSIFGVWYRDYYTMTFVLNNWLVTHKQ